MAVTDVAETELNQLQRLCKNIGLAVRGKDEVIRLAVTGLLAEGHLLIEDIPGVGKTTLARAIARSLDLPMRRIQFTADLLPSDIIGVSIYDEAQGSFVFHRGPVFHAVVLADEINRAGPRTQSALLEAMDERQVTVDNATYPLPRPFIVLATQNPLEVHGTFPLPESQLDRFLLRLGLGYPDADTERALLAARGRKEPVESLEPVMRAQDLEVLMDAVDEVHVEPSLVDALLAIAEATRRHPRIEVGISTRAALTTLRATRAHALVEGRRFALPDDLLSVVVPALAHRMRLAGSTSFSGALRMEAERLLREIVAKTPMPQ